MLIRKMILTELLQNTSQFDADDRNGTQHDRLMIVIHGTEVS